jgi:hypothetical protein
MSEIDDLIRLARRNQQLAAFEAHHAIFEKALLAALTGAAASTQGPRPIAEQAVSIADQTVKALVEAGHLPPLPKEE